MYFTYQTIIGNVVIEEQEGCITRLALNSTTPSSQTSTIQQQQTPLIREAYKQLTEYLDGKRSNFTIPLRYHGTEFQQAVWNELQKIPYGTTVTYKQIAQRIGNEKAVRAVGMANNKNQLPIFIPCHRVVGSNGKLIGYAGGIELKEQLLALEQI